MRPSPPLIVAGLSLKNLKPSVWDSSSEWYLPKLGAVMVSYADLQSRPAARRTAMTLGLRVMLRVPDHVKVYLDNGAFNLSRRGGEFSDAEYETFVQHARPDWYPIPRDYIPAPAAHHNTQRAAFRKTMEKNRAYRHDGFVPVMHVGKMLRKYIRELSDDPLISQKPHLALGGIVPNLLRASSAMPYVDVIVSLFDTRAAFRDKDIHVFGMGGTATIHLATVLGYDSIDSSGWRSRAARGIVQLPGLGDRMVSPLGNWSGRAVSADEMRLLRQCLCPGCKVRGISGLTNKGIDGFAHRACHNLWVLLEEAAWIEKCMASGSYLRQLGRRVDNSIFAKLIFHAATLD